MNSYNDVTFSEVMNENDRVKNFNRELNLLIISNINFKSPGEAILKYVLEREYKVKINIESNYDFDLIDYNADNVFDYGICLYYRNKLEEDIDGSKAFEFFRKIHEATRKNVKYLVCIVDAFYNLHVKQEVRNYINECEEHPKIYYDLYELGTCDERYYWYDLRNYLSYDCPYSIEGCFEIAFLLLRCIRNAEACYKKCLVLDCDNVLWGGILEEKGMDGVSLDSVYPGNVYYHFQKYIRYLMTKGVIVALCSKNEEDEVLNLINIHPFMLLREDLVAAYRINWNNKVQNIIDLSQELNIELSDFVFVDDSPEEIGMIQELLPEVFSILFDNYFKFHYIEYFHRIGLFREENITEEDLNRTQMYIAESRRQKSKKKIIDEKRYLDSLKMKLTKEKLNSFNIKRIVQLSERTHKANLTSRIYTCQQLESLSQNQSVFCFKLSDRYGDYGYISAIIVRVDEGDLYIEDFYLSCRALGKNVEQMILNCIVMDSEHKINRIFYNYKENEKNRGFEMIFRKTLSELSMNRVERVELSAIR